MASLQGFKPNKSIEDISTSRTLVYQNGSFFVYAQRTGDTVILWATGRGVSAGDVTFTMPEQFRPASGLELPIFQRSPNDAELSPAGQMTLVYNGTCKMRFMSGVTASTYLIINGAFAGRDL